jgi:hypothetical protein
VVNPLGARSTRKAHERLHDAIRDLNRGQQQQLIRFSGDGTGQGITWEAVSQLG